MTDAIKIGAILAGVTALAFAVVFLLFLTTLLRTEELRVSNESGTSVSVVLGLSSIVLAPGESGTLENEFDQSTDDLQIFGVTYNVCDWDEVRREQPLRVTDNGAQCRDTRPVVSDPAQVQ